MKTVYLLRHAKSSWDEPALPDFQRPLAPRGRKAGPRMGTFMREQGLVPDQVLCSAARRAVETWEFISEALEKRIPAEIREDFYHASPQTLLSAIRALSPELESVLLVGHNPTMENLALSLAGHGEEGILREMRLKYPTGALAILDFPVSSWADVREGGGHLRGFIRPRHLK